MDALLHRQDFNHIRFQTLLARITPGGDADTWDGVSLAVTGSPISEFNTAIVTLPPTAADTYDELVRRLDGCGGPYTVQVPDDIVERVGPELRDRGLGEPYEVPGMRMRVARHREPELPEGLSVTQVTSLHDHVRFVETAAAAFGMGTEAAAEVNRPQLLREPDYAELLGLVSGEPVATAVGLRTDDVVGIYAIAVPTRYRRQGLGRALTEAAVAWGTAAGATTAVLQASLGVLGVYRGMGFRTVRTYHRFPGGGGP